MEVSLRSNALRTLLEQVEMIDMGRTTEELEAIKEECRKTGKQRLDSRMARLARLVNLDAPVYVMATEAAMVLDALRMMDPEAVAKALGARAHADLMRRAERCQNCFAPLKATEDRSQCDACNAEVAEEDEEDAGLHLVPKA